LVSIRLDPLYPSSDSACRRYTNKIRADFDFMKQGNGSHINNYLRVTVTSGHPTRLRIGVARVEPRRALPVTSHAMRGRPARDPSILASVSETSPSPMYFGGYGALSSDRSFNLFKPNSRIFCYSLLCVAYPQHWGGELPAGRLERFEASYALLA
jgi:hypothetical protein